MSTETPDPNGDSVDKSAETNISSDASEESDSVDAREIDTTHECPLCGATRSAVIRRSPIDNDLVECLECEIRFYVESAGGVSA